MRTGWFGELPADRGNGPLRRLVDGVAGVAGAVLLAVAWRVSVQVVLSRLVGPPLPPPLTFALLSTPPGLALFAGTALLASAAAAEPHAAPPRRPAAR